MKFAHMGDCHLGGWRQPELRELNFRCFQTAIDRCIREKVEFILITGDLFDNPYPSIDTLKEVFLEFRKLKDVAIPVFLIAGSHDYSVSGKTFLDVLDKAGFCKNVAVYEERDGKILLFPTLHKNVAIYGYPGKKSSLEVEDIERLTLHDAPGLFKILMLHTALRDAVGTLPINAVDHRQLPQVNYLALSHLHITYAREGRVYSGPIFPNNLTELEELQGGSFYIFDNGKIRREELKLKPVISLTLEIKDAFKATEEIIAFLQESLLKDAIVILKLQGMLEKGKLTDIDFTKIGADVKKKGAYVFLKSSTQLHLAESDINIEVLDTQHLEQQLMTRFMEVNPGEFNALVPQLMKALHIEKSEDEKAQVFEEKVFEEAKKVLNL